MENAGSWTVSGSRGDGSPEEVQGFAKTWRKKYSAVQRSKRAISCMHACTFSTPKPRFGTVLVRSVHDCETGWLASLCSLLALDQ